MANDFAVDYEALEDFRNKFREAAELVEVMEQHLKQNMEDLRDGWMGSGAKAFFAEMDDEVLPAVRRLSEALGEADSVVGQTVDVVREAERSAAALFNAAVGGGDGGSKAGAVAGGGGGGGNAGAMTKKDPYRDAKNTLGGLKKLFKDELDTGMNFLTEQISDAYGAALGGDSLDMLQNKFGFLEKYGGITSKVALPGLVDGLIDYGFGGNYDGQELATQLISSTIQAGLQYNPVTGPFFQGLDKLSVASGMIETGLRASGFGEAADVAGKVKDFFDIDQEMDAMVGAGVAWASDNGPKIVDNVKGWFGF